MILAIICAGLLAGVVYTVTKGKSGTQKKQEASAEAGADETESQSGIIGEDGKKYKQTLRLKEVLGSDFNANMTVADVKEVTAPEGAKLAAVAAFGLKKKVVR